MLTHSHNVEENPDFDDTVSYKMPLTRRHGKALQPRPGLPLPMMEGAEKNVISGMKFRRRRLRNANELVGVEENGEERKRTWRSCGC